jgi:2-phosphosulfolactate phosphatase
MISPYAQDGFRARFDWGPAGAEAVGPGAGIVAVLDVLSFTTALTVAIDQGIEVFPYRWRDCTAVSHAERHKAVLAVGRAQATELGQVSLSPATIRQSTGIERLVLPSPNGSAISHKLAAAGSRVIGVSLRNVDAAADWTTSRLREAPRTVVAVIAAGERWTDGSLRPALEDLWGAGAFLAGLADRGIGPLSPEAEAAAAAYRQAADRLPQLLADCAGGRELIGYGYPQDVAIAGEINASRSLPVLDGNSFRVVPETPVAV